MPWQAIGKKVLDAGMNDHIAKPINVNEMFHLMAKWITPAHPVTEVVDKAAIEQMSILDLDGINTADGLKRVQGNSAFYLKLLRKTATSQKDFMREFSEAVQHENWELSTRLAHTLKGVAGNIGAESLQGACADLEKLAHNRRTDSKTLESVEIELQRVLSSVASLSDDISDNSKQEDLPLDYPAVANVLTTLAEQCLEYDTSALETIETNAALFSTDVLQSEVSLLGKALEDYDFEAAEAVIEKMQQWLAGKTSEK